MSVTYVSGNIVDDPSDIIVNTVNCFGVAGAGIALAFKQRWPSIMKDYQLACREKRLRPGVCLLFPHPESPTRHWAALVTKYDWRNSSRYDWVEHGLWELMLLARNAAAKTIALPPPGCGNGGLDWECVRPIVFNMLSEFNLRIYGVHF